MKLRAVACLYGFATGKQRRLFKFILNYDCPLKTCLIVEQNFQVIEKYQHVFKIITATAKINLK